jgi:hypothetical protein
VNARASFYIRSAIAVLALCASTAHAAQKLKDADCLACHGDNTLTKDVNGKPVSLFVDEGKLKHSIHGSLLACVDCHADVKSLVHEAPPNKITCAQCHADAQAAYAHSSHAQAAKSGGTPAASCENCHSGPHEILGTALMGITGVMLWSKVWVGDLLARWWVDVATAVHFYEAILATLAILVWHFYQVFFDPDVYPMNSAWWDGKMPIDHYREEHELDRETLTHPVEDEPRVEPPQGPGSTTD